ncbi:hypothetical protein P8452_22720 [Trifolium repens]|nr:hypothetical protein P8452_22720 [Trifolium repens]
MKIKKHSSLSTYFHFSLSLSIPSLSSNSLHQENTVFCIKMKQSQLRHNLTEILYFIFSPTKDLIFYSSLFTMANLNIYLYKSCC